MNGEYCPYGMKVMPQTLQLAYQQSEFEDNYHNICMIATLKRGRQFYNSLLMISFFFQHVPIGVDVLLTLSLSTKWLCKFRVYLHFSAAAIASR